MQNTQNTRYRLVLSMMAVIIPGLVISILGIVYVSQQRNARELKLREKYETMLAQIRDETERQMEAAIEKTIKQIAVPGTAAAVKEPGTLQNLLKAVLLQNPVVKYPFLIDAEGTYIFPFSKRTGLLREGPATANDRFYDRYGKGTGKGSIFYKKYREAEDLEFRERDFYKAIKRYLGSLEKARTVGTGNVRFYVFFAIARCYYKLNKFPQAADYLEDILGEYPGAVNEDKTFYFGVLHQAARTYERMNLREKAVAHYLRLYDEILQYETTEAPGEKESYGFFKNEALDYLNRNIKEEEGDRESQRFTRARAREGLDKLSELDITLRWQFFEVTPPPVVDRKDDDAFTFDKIREFYLPKDEKTLFYKEVKELKPWTRTDIAFAGITGENPGTPPLFFGFLISFDFLQAGVLQQAARKHLGDEADDGLVVSVETDGGATGFQLVRLPFKRFFTSRFLVLHADRKGYVEATVEKDLWINYGLIAAIIALFILGTWFFYKYITREAELVRMKSDFVDSASHTLKTPLTRIRMMAEKMELGWIKDEKKKKEYFRAIISETDRMAEMITNMLDFSKVESGKKHYQMEQASITELVRAVIDSLTPHIESLGFQLEVKIGEDIPSFSFDPGAVRLILVNLVQNALKYAAEGKYIGIKLYKDGSRAAMKVTDRGMGIPVAEWENIFNKFYRVPDDTVKAMEGSGLGLFLVHHAVNAHNGTIAVKSAPGKGSTFTVTLPLKK